MEKGKLEWMNLRLELESVYYQQISMLENKFKKEKVKFEEEYFNVVWDLK